LLCSGGGDAELEVVGCQVVICEGNSDRRRSSVGSYEEVGGAGGVSGVQIREGIGR
jgi:hypothetical protein